MAGLYPDVPGPRLAYDRDGTVGLNTNSGFTAVAGQLTSTQLRALNDETITTVVAGGGLCLIFPELRDIVGVYLDHGEQSSGSTPGMSPLYWSPDTTNGIDGTWTSLGAQGDGFFTASPTRMRNNIKPLAQPGVRGLRVAQSGGGATITYRIWHVYGSPSDPNDCLRLWHPSLDQEVGGSHFDWADFRRLSSDDRQFRVKNNSDTLTASTITVSAEAPTDTTPSVAAQHLFSADGTNFGASVVIPSLAPGALSDPITLRRVTPSNAFLSLWWARVAAVAGVWT